MHNIYSIAVKYSKRQNVVIKQTKEIGQPTRVIRLIYDGDNHQFRFNKGVTQAIAKQTAKTVTF